MEGSSIKPKVCNLRSKNVSNAMNPATLSDDLVFDKETGLTWTRDANLLGQHNWPYSNTVCREWNSEIGSG
jgi:hypothetical protein